MANVSPHSKYSKSRGTTNFLLGLKSLNDGRELTQQLVSLLVVLDLGGDELSQVTKGLGGVQNLSHVSR